MQITFQESVWVTDPEQVRDLDLSDPISVQFSTHRTATDTDMTYSGWIRVGTSVTTVTIEESFSRLRNRAARKCDEKINQLQAEVEVKVNALRQLKAELMCLEGPANV